MYARVSTFDGPAGLSDADIAEMNKDLEATILPKVRAMAGFKGVISLMDSATGRTISVTLWESQDAMQASEADANTARDDAAGIERSKIVDVSRYQVTMFEMS